MSIVRRRRRTDAEVKEEIFWGLLKSHGYIGLFSHLVHNVDIHDKQRIKAVVKNWKDAKPINPPDFTSPLYKRIAMSAGKELEYMVYNAQIRNHVVYWSDNTKQTLYGVAPPFQLYLNTPPKAREIIFYESLQSASVVVGKVISYLPSDLEYVVHILAFADGRTFYIADLNINMYISQFDYPNLEVGCFLKALYCTANMDARKMYLTTDVRILKKATGIKLGIISEEGLPLHYRLSQERPIKPRKSYLKKQFTCTKKMMNMFNIRNDKIYSFNKELRSIKYPVGEIPAHKREKANFLNLDTLDAGDYYNNGDIVNSLKKLGEALEIDPDNVSVLKDRGTIYGNLGMYKKAFKDLYRCLDLGCRTVLAYICELTMSQSELFEGRREYAAASACYMRLLKFPCFRDDNQIIFKYMFLAAKCEFETYVNPMTNLTEAPDFESYFAIHDFQAADFDEVSFVKGDVIINCSGVGIGWLVGTVQKTGNIGLLPINFVQLIE